jgi:hypothetical protein
VVGRWAEDEGETEGGASLLTTRLLRGGKAKRILTPEKRRVGRVR